MAGREGKTYETPAYLAEPPQWYFMSINQTSTILSLLTPEYRQRAVQMHYHQAVTNAPLWPGTFCWPDGFMRLFSRQGAPRDGLRDDTGARAAHGQQR